MPLESLQNGRYRLLRPLGSGSMGEVYLVDDTRINRQVAIKVVRTDASPYPTIDTISEATRLFDREAKAIARLNHPNILPLYDYGEEIVNGAPLTYMVMPYSPEGSLATWLQQRGDTQPLPPHEIAHFLRQAADALQHAHEHGIIHQDVKPSNFLIRSKNTGLPDLLLADFGIAKLAAGTAGTSQAIRGTPIYMAPEQWEGHPVPASDQYALAIMIYQLLSGRAPFQGGPGQIMYQHLNVTPQPPSTLNPILTPEIDRILLRALAKRPSDRFPTVSAFADALQQALLRLGDPTIANTTGRLPSNSISAVLAISPAEALTGTQRVLSLPGGRQVIVHVPAGVQNGQVLHVEDPNITPGNIPAEPLLLTISIVSSEAPNPSLLPYLSGNTIFTGGTVLTNPDRDLFDDNAPTEEEPIILPPVAEPPIVQRREPSYRPTPPAYYNVQSPYQTANVNNVASPRVYPRSTPTDDRRRPSTGLAILAAILIFLVIVGGLGLFLLISSNQATISNANATATAQANQASINSANDTATAQANQANSTGTAQANSTGTAIANATAHTQNNATATAQSATATATNTPTFKVQSITIAVNPTSIAGIPCGTFVTITYTATFTLTPNGPGGTVQFTYSVNNGHSSNPGSLTFAPSETTKTFAFTWSGNLPPDHTYPGIGIVMTTSPNSVTSPGVAPTGQCTSGTPGTTPTPSSTP